MSNKDMAEFQILGPPQPQKRPRAFTRGKHAKVYSPTSEQKVKVSQAAHMLKGDGYYFDDAVSVRIYYYFHRPKSHYGTGKNSNVIKDSAPHHHIKRPDLDNLNKAVLDGITDGGLWSDDSIVCHLSVVKQYIDRDDTQRTHVIIERR